MQFKPVFSRFSVIAILLLSLQVSLSQPLSAAACVSQASGDWTNPATWTGCGGGYPGQTTNDAVTIGSGHVVTLDANPANALYNLVINAGGTFNGGSSTLKFSAAGGTPGPTNNGTFNAQTGTIGFDTSYGGQSSTVGGTITFNHVDISGVGVDFGSNSTVTGILTLNNGSYVNTNPPTYATGSTLKYNTGGNYGRGAEWNTQNPYHLQVSNNTTLEYPNGSTAARTLGGNLTIDAGSSLYMDYGSPTLNNPLTVGGNLTLNGNMSLGDAAGGNLILGGNWTFNTGANFYNQSRTVILNGTNQTIGGSQATTFYDLTKTNAGTIDFGSLNQVVSHGLNLAGTACTNLITINGSAILNNTGATNTLDFVNVNTPPTLSVAATAANGVPFGGNVAKGWTVTTSCVVPIYSSVPAPNAFGMTSTNGTVTTQAINVSNPGTSNLVISSVAWNGIPGSWFSLLSSATPTLGAGVGPAQIANIQCNPGGVKSGSQTAVLRVTHNATGSPVDYTITCTSAAFVGGVAQTIELTTKSTPWGLMILSGIMLLAAGVLMARHRR